MAVDVWKADLNADGGDWTRPAESSSTHLAAAQPQEEPQYHHWTPHYRHLHLKKPMDLNNKYIFNTHCCKYTNSLQMEIILNSRIRLLRIKDPRNAYIQ